MQRKIVTTSQQGSAVTLLSPYEQTTNRLAAIVASVSKAKDCVCLFGDVGAGKSVFRCATRLLANAPSQRPASAERKS